ncbi:MAG: glycoside hydrolase family 3 C-terminal domain-containing protein, partial [Clostridia bacterium]|nr:glycoside hydrolase family 3 C-terminal domain-containing protein [Clostridia bacterium]
MKPSTKRTLKKVFLNVTTALFAVVFTGNVIAGENAGQINQVLGTVTSKTISTAPAGMEETYARYFESRYSSLAELKAAGEAKVREVESEGIVLLKNDNGALPLAKGGKVSLVGVTVMDPVYGGTGSGAVDADGAPNFYDMMTGAGFQVVDKPLLDYYVENEVKRDAHSIGEDRWRKVSKNNDDTIGQGEDAIYVVGRVGGEGNDVTAEKEDALDGDYLTLNEDELSILEGLKELKDDGAIRSITVIINSANPISTAFLYDEAYGVDAALWIGSVGQTGLYAVGDVLSGAVNPSGSLPDTWWMDNQKDPVMNNFGAYTYEGADAFTFSAAAPFVKYVVYQEGIYLGYKYTETRYEDVVMGTPNAGAFDYASVVSYPFGYGLSYSEYSFSDMNVEKAGQGQDTKYTMTVTVTNTGAAAGKKTVQVYAQKPYTDYDRENHIEKAAVELVGYAKTKLLNPGESETVTVDVPEFYLTSFDAYGSGVYILDEGSYYLTAAQNAHEAENNILAAKGYTAANGMTADGNAS